MVTSLVSCQDASQIKYVSAWAPRQYAVQQTFLTLCSNYQHSGIRQPFVYLGSGMTIKCDSELDDEQYLLL